MTTELWQEEMFYSNWPGRTQAVQVVILESPNLNMLMAIKKTPTTTLLMQLTLERLRYRYQEFSRHPGPTILYFLLRSYGVILNLAIYLTSRLNSSFYEQRKD